MARQGTQGGSGGWIPVVNQWRGGGSKGLVSRTGLSTVFVDNLSSSMDAKSSWITRLHPFQKKESDKHKKANGLLVDDRVLEVKYAIHERNARAVHSRGWPLTNREALGTHGGKCRLPFTGHKSFAEVLKGDTRSMTRSAATTIKVNDDGHGWLYESAIIRLHSDYSIHSIRKALKEKGLHQVVVRERGGRDVILTFQSQEELKSNIHSIKEWFQAWSLFVLEWNPVAHIQQERCVWLRCQGIPLHLWNKNTLNSIGSLWGTIFHLESDISCPDSFSYSRIKVVTLCMEPIGKTINLECKGKLHPILVYEDHLGSAEESSNNSAVEDCSSNVNFCKVAEASPSEECFKGEEGEAEVAARRNLSGAGASLNKVARRTEPTHGLNEEDVDTRVEESPCDVEFSRPSVVGAREAMMEERAPCPKCNDKSERCVEQVSTAGFFKSLSGPRVDLGLGISLEVDLALPLREQCIQSPLEAQNIRPTSNGLLLFNSPGPHTGISTSGPKVLSIHDQGQVKSSSFSLNHLRNTRKPERKKAQIKGFSRFAHLSAISKNSSKPVIFTPGVATLAQSNLSEGYSSHHSFLLKEAAGTVQLGQKLGINFQGKEDVGLDKINDLELKDKERIIKEGKAKM
ncbi:hypothetical protein ACSBR1_025760 [Camellia fascicularis]